VHPFTEVIFVLIIFFIVLFYLSSDKRREEKQDEKLQGLEDFCRGTLTSLVNRCINAVKESEDMNKATRDSIQQIADDIHEIKIQNCCYSKDKELSGEDCPICNKE
jgi:phosphoribosyl-dephospho-CoA transferase